MRKIIKAISEILGMLISIFYCHKFNELMYASLSHVYTGILKRHFKHLGNGTVIGYKAEKLMGLSNISIGDNTQIESNVQLTSWFMTENKNHEPEIVIGSDCKLRRGLHISAVGSIKIGNGVLTGTNVLISDNSHGSLDRASIGIRPYERKLICKGPIVIEDNVWLGNNVCVLSGVKIGKGSIIGANAVVTHDIPEFSMAAGVPANVLNSLK